MIVLGFAIGLSCIALTLWLLQDEMRRTRRPELWVVVCPCGWESPPQTSERDARTVYDQHVSYSIRDFHHIIDSIRDDQNIIEAIPRRKASDR